MAAEELTLRDSNYAVRQPLPPGHQQSELDHEASAHAAGSFLLTKSTNKFTPVDEETGVTFPIVTTRALPPIGKGHDEAGKIMADWNHTYHPRARLMGGSVTDIGLRNARVEWVHRNDHNAYHREFSGPDIDSYIDLIQPILFSAAGFIPEKGLQYDGAKEAEVVLLSLEHRLHLWRSGRIKVANPTLVRNALLDRALQSDFSGINTTTIDEFLSTNDQKRRLQLGNTLLSLAIHDSLNPMRKLYKDLWKRQYLPPTNASTLGKFTLRTIDRLNRKQAFRALDARLRVAA